MVECLQLPRTIRLQSFWCFCVFVVLIDTKKGQHFVARMLLLSAQYILKVARFFRF